MTFDAMKMLERNSDCINRLTSLVSDLKLTMDRKQPQYKPKIYQGRSQSQNTGQKNLLLEIDLLVEEEIKVVIDEIIIIGTITGKIIEIDQEAGGTIIGQVIGVLIIQIITDKVIQDRTLDKTQNGHLETEVKVEVGMKTVVIIKLEVEVEIEIKGDGKNPGLDLIKG